MAAYQRLRDSATVLRRADQAYIPDDPANLDRQQYEAWVAKGNEADPPEPLPEPSPAIDEVIAALTRRIETLEHREHRE